MDLTQILNEIETRRSEVQKELRGLDAAVAALSGLGKSGQPRVGRAGRRRGLSAAARARISAAQKARWAKLKRRKLAA
jgi:hypothetical protein